MVRAHQQDGGGLAPAEHHGEHQGRRVEGDPDGEPARDQEEQAGEGAGAAVESLLEVLVGGVDTGAVEERHQGDAEDDHGEGQAEVDDEEAHPLGEGLPGGAHEGDGADLRRHDRQADRPPGHLPAGQEEIVDLPVAASHVDAEADDEHEVDAEDGPVRGG